MRQSSEAKARETQPGNAAVSQDAYTDDLVALWDGLVGWRGRAEREGQFFTDLLRRHNVHHVLDAATGTGFHAVAFAEAGFRVTAVDGSEKMVVKARENLATRDLDVACEAADWRELSKVLQGPFDAVVCLGNSLAHLSTTTDLEATLSEFYRALIPGGLLVVDHRNYDALLDGKSTSQSQSYCCCGGDASVALEVVEPALVRITYRLGTEVAHQIDTHPWRCRSMVSAIERTGFTDVVTYGDLHREFDSSRVEFFIHSARRTT